MTTKTSSAWSIPWDPVTGSRCVGPWGEPRSTTGELSNLGFQGDVTDPDTCLVDMTTRNYDPILGRFTTKDVVSGSPGRPGSMNQFTYGENSPSTTAIPRA